MKNELFSRLWQRTDGRICLYVLALFYAAAALAPFLSPYESSTQELKKSFHPPTALRWSSSGLAVQVYRNVDPTAANWQPIPGETTPIIWFPVVEKPRYLLGFIPLGRSLFSVDAAHRVYLLGSDSTGRDVFSRLLYGSQISLTIGIVGIIISTLIAVIVGGLAGYFGGWFDTVAMRITELLMSVPGLFLLIALRAALADFFKDPALVYFMVVCILSFIGWSGTARVIRGYVLSLRNRPFIAAAEALGQSPWIILWRHLLPNLSSYLVVTSTLSIPGYILGEAGLSFLGLGISEPASSWGLMLAQSQELKVFKLNFWWLLIPGAAILIIVMIYNILGDVMRDIIDPRQNTQR